MKKYDNRFFGEKRMVFQKNTEPNPVTANPTEATLNKNDLRKNIDNTVQQKADEIAKEMPTMKEEKFYALSQTEQLLAITEPPKIVNDFKVDEEAIIITFHGNKTLETRITAGTFPIQVEEITVNTNGNTLTGKRRGLSGEFYAENGERLRIYEGTTVTIGKTRTAEEMTKIQEENKAKVDKYNGDKNVAKMAYEEDVPPEMVEMIAEGKADPVEIQKIITEIGRERGRFMEMYGDEGHKTEIEKDGVMIPSPEFVGFVFKASEDIESIGKILRLSDVEMKTAKDFSAQHKEIEMSQRNVQLRVDHTAFERMLQENNKKRYPPFSSEAKQLFTDAAKTLGLPENWGSSNALHNILSRESDGIVGRPNYTYANANNPQEWDNIHEELKRGKITAKSSATGLGQLLLSNVEKYYPSGKDGIGVASEEAIGMLSYIKDRYGTPEEAWRQYGKNHEGY